MGIVHQRRKAETRALLVAAGLELFAEHGFEIATLDEVALAAGFTKGAIYRHFPSKGAFLLALFEQYAAVARAGSGARQAPWFIPLTLQFAAHAVRDPKQDLHPNSLHYWNYEKLKERKSASSRAQRFL